MQQRGWVVAYDVSLNRRRCRIAKQLESHGIRLQKSVFLVTAAPQAVRRLVREIGKEIDPATDCVCAWPLSLGWQAEQIAIPAEAAPLQTSFVIG